MKFPLLALTLLLIPFMLQGKRLNKERYYQDQFAAKIGGMTEVIASDGTRCDILTKTEAIEVDFADKWAEAIGQSLNYGFQFNRKPGILLILEHQDDYKHLIRVESIIRNYQLPIKVYDLKVYENNTPKQVKKNKQEPADAALYWISSTRKTHNKSCRYYKKGKGHLSAKPSGNNCKICGGAH